MSDNEISCRWLSPLVLMDDFGVNWYKYDNYLYQIFKKDFIDSKPYYKEKPVNIRKHPTVADKEQAYFHVTSVDSSKTPEDANDRIPDLRRCERVAWIRQIIENHLCSDNCNGCNKIKYWPELYKGKRRWHLLFEDYKFLVIIEERQDYNLLISSFYIERDHQLKKKLKKYEKYKIL